MPPINYAERFRVGERVRADGRECEVFFIRFNAVKVRFDGDEKFYVFDERYVEKLEPENEEAK